MNEFNNSVKQNNKAILIGITVSIIALLLCLSVSFVFGPKKAIADPDDLQTTLDRTSNEYFAALNAKEEAQAEVDEANSTIAECEWQIPIVEGKLCARAKSLYINRGFGEILQLIIGATSIKELIDNIHYIAIINFRDSNLVKSCKTLKATIESKKVTLEENLAEASRQADIAAAAYEAAQVALAAAREAAERQQQEHGGGGYTPSKPAEYLGDVVATAYACEGYPYAWGESGPYSFDCSGLVCWCYGVGGYRRHPYTTHTFVNEWEGFHRIDASQALAGDVVSTSEHCGIYIGNGLMIHAPTTGDVVKQSKVQDGMGYYTKR